MDVEKINPEFLKVEFVIYFMQTLFQPQTIIFTPERGVEARHQTLDRDIKKLQFEDGYIGDLPPDVEDGRLSITLGSMINIETARELVPLIQKICRDVAQESPEIDPEAFLQFFVGARTSCLLKEEAVSYIYAPYITKKSVSEAFMQLLGSRITEELSRFKLKRPGVIDMGLVPDTSDPEFYTLNFSFSGELARHQFVAMQKEILVSTNEFSGVMEVDPEDFCLSYKCSGMLVNTSLVSASFFIKKGEDEKRDLYLTRLKTKIESAFPGITRQ